jgi:spermidine synthase
VIERDEPARRGVRASVLIAFGFFPIFAQALLFRAFLNQFEGHEFAVGCFFGSWLLWLGAGGLAARRVRGVAGHFAPWLLLYLPLFALQYMLILNARTLGGVQPFEFFPLRKVLAVALLMNAPTSLWTGVLFPSACRWAARPGVLPLARVYALESLGSFAGGVGVTWLLVSGVRAETAFLAAGLLLAAIVLAHEIAAGARRGAWTAGLVAAALAGAIGLRLDQRASNVLEERDWTRLLPEGVYAGSFSTEQGVYRYGFYGAQFNVAAGRGITETIPELERASEQVALHLAQKADARRVLVVGVGAYGLCSRFLDLPQMEEMVWMHPDPLFPGKLKQVLPGDLRREDRRWSLPAVDIRHYLKEKSGYFDLMILKLPDATSLVLNRYFTREFFALAKHALEPGGVLSVRVSGGENYLGGDLALLGGSVYLALNEAFEHLVLKPGDETWLMASDGESLSEEPGVLMRQFAAAPGSDAVYPREGVTALYPRDRIAFQHDRYRKAIDRAPLALIENTDRHPRAMLHALLLAVRQSGGGEGWSRGVAALAVGGLRMVVAVALMAMALRIVYLLRGRGPKTSVLRSGDALFLIFSTGFAGMVLAVVLMFQYQMRFGSLALHAGLLSALFMLGLYAGSRSGETRVATPAGLRRWLFAMLCAELALLSVSAAMPSASPRTLFLALFFVAGFVTGAFVPVAAIPLRMTAPDDEGAGGAAFILVDNLGGAMGGLAASLLLVPLLGAPAAMLGMALLLAPNVLALAPSATPDPRADRFDRMVRPVGYTIFGITAAFVIVSNFLAAAREPMGSALERVAHAMARDKGSEAKKIRPDLFAVVRKDGSTNAWVYSTAPWTTGLRGYGGRIVLAVMADEKGNVLDLRVAESRETPSYLARVKPWLSGLIGRNLFREEFTRLDGVAGATITSETVLKSLQQAGRGLASGRRETPERAAVDPRPAYLLALAACAVALRWCPGRRLRTLLLLTVVVVAGLHLNAQYSLDQVYALLSLKPPEFGWSPACFMVMGVPLLVLVFGNVYCGSLCPFGALQEVLGDLPPRRIRSDPDKETWRYTRAVKYVALGCALAWFSVDLNRARAAADPLVTVFSVDMLRQPSLLTLFVLAASLVFRRFWCRNLCPAGAFLSLLGSVRLLHRWLPATQPARCDMGVRAAAEMDCLQCDRCRMPDAAHAPAGGTSPLLAALVALATIALLHRGRVQSSLMKEAERASAVKSETGRPADMRAIKGLIEQRRLSDREAMFYKPYVADDGEP